MERRSLTSSVLFANAACCCLRTEVACSLTPVAHALWQRALSCGVPTAQRGAPPPALLPSVVAPPAARVRPAGKGDAVEPRLRVVARSDSATVPRRALAPATCRAEACPSTPATHADWTELNTRTRCVF